MISIVLVDNNDQDRERIVAQLKPHADFAIRDFGYDAYDAIKLAKKYEPDIAILDLNLNFFDEIEISSLLKRNSPKTSVVLMSSSTEWPMIKRSVGGKASAYLFKEEDLNDLAVILRKVMAGEMYLNPIIGIWAFKLLGEVLPENRQDKFRQNTVKRKPPEYQDLMRYNRREKQLLKLIGQGLTVREIAECLLLKEGTARNYVSRVMKKAGFANRAQLIRYAIDSGIAGY